MGSSLRLDHAAEETWQVHWAKRSSNVSRTYARICWFILTETFFSLIFNQNISMSEVPKTFETSSSSVHLTSSITKLLSADLLAIRTPHVDKKKAVLCIQNYPNRYITVQPCKVEGSKDYRKMKIRLHQETVANRWCQTMLTYLQK